jgi:predicted DNA-binding protein with PD1-like motif
VRFFRDTAAGFVVVSLGYGDLLMESLRDVARQADIHTGILTTGIGSLQKARIHTVITNDYPPENAFFDLDGPLEVVQFGGIIADYEPHVHISLWDKERRYWGGHLEDGCQVLTLSEISIRVLPELRLTRRKNEVGTSLLHEVT